MIREDIFRRYLPCMRRSRNTSTHQHINTKRLPRRRLGKAGGTRNMEQLMSNEIILSGFFTPKKTSAIDRGGGAVTPSFIVARPRGCACCGRRPHVPQNREHVLAMG